MQWKFWSDCVNALQHKKKHMQVGEFHFVRGGGLLRQRCGVAYVTRASNWGYWLTVGQGLISLQQVRVEGGVFIFSVSLLSFSFALSFLSFSLISSTISSISLLPFSGRRHKMTHKGWHVVKPQNNQSLCTHTGVDKFKKYLPLFPQHIMKVMNWLMLFSMDCSILFTNKYKHSQKSWSTLSTRAKGKPYFYES